MNLEDLVAVPGKSKIEAAKELIRILQIEDDSEYVQFVKQKLRKSKLAEFTLQSAADLSEGLKLLESDGIDLILLDLNLPDSHGIDTFLAVHERVPHLPVIILTAIDDETLAMKSIQLGAEAYHVKNEVKNQNLPRSINYSYKRFKARNSDLRRRERDKEDYFRNALEGNMDGIVVVDGDGKVLYVNPAAEFLFGRKEDELVGHPLGFPVVADRKTEINILHKSGTGIVVEMRSVEIKWGGEDAFLASLRDITDHKKKESILYNLSISDDLTSLYNRRGFTSLADRHIRSATKSKKYFTVFFIDLDGLKNINDTFGHLVGSKVLRDSAMLLTETFRSSDIISRFGGDEFVVLAKGLTENNVGMIKDRLEENIESYNNTSSNSFKLSMSVGAAFFDPSKPATIDGLVNSADERMYADKQGKNTRSGRTVL